MSSSRFDDGDSGGGSTSRTRVSRFQRRRASELTEAEREAEEVARARRSRERDGPDRETGRRETGDPVTGIEAGGPVASEAARVGGPEVTDVSRTRRGPVERLVGGARERVETVRERAGERIEAGREAVAGAAEEARETAAQARERVEASPVGASVGTGAAAVGEAREAEEAFFERSDEFIEEQTGFDVEAFRERAREREAAEQEREERILSDVTGGAAEVAGEIARGAPERTTEGAPILGGTPPLVGPSAIGGIARAAGRGGAATVEGAATGGGTVGGAGGAVGTARAGAARVAGGVESFLRTGAAAGGATIAGRERISELPVQEPTQAVEELEPGEPREAVTEIGVPEERPGREGELPVSEPREAVSEIAVPEERPGRTGEIPVPTIEAGPATGVGRGRREEEEEESLEEMLERFEEARGEEFRRREAGRRGRMVQERIEEEGGLEGGGGVARPEGIRGREPAGESPLARRRRETVTGAGPSALRERRSERIQEALERDSPTTRESPALGGFVSGERGRVERAREPGFGQFERERVRETAEMPTVGAEGGRTQVEGIIVGERERSERSQEPGFGLIGRAGRRERMGLDIGTGTVSGAIGRLEAAQDVGVRAAQTPRAVTTTDVTQGVRERSLLVQEPTLTTGEDLLETPITRPVDTPTTTGEVTTPGLGEPTTPEMGDPFEPGTGDPTTPGFGDPFVPGPPTTTPPTFTGEPPPTDIPEPIPTDDPDDRRRRDPSDPFDRFFFTPISGVIGVDSVGGEAEGVGVTATLGRREPRAFEEATTEGDVTVGPADDAGTGFEEVGGALAPADGSGPSITEEVDADALELGAPSEDQTRVRDVIEPEDEPSVEEVSSDNAINGPGGNPILSEHMPATPSASGSVSINDGSDGSDGSDASEDTTMTERNATGALRTALPFFAVPAVGGFALGSIDAATGESSFADDPGIGESFESFSGLSGAAGTTLIAGSLLGATSAAFGGASTGAINGAGGNPILPDHMPPTPSRRDSDERRNASGSSIVGNDVDVGEQEDGEFVPVLPDQSGEPDWHNNPDDLDSPAEVTDAIEERGLNPGDVGTLREAAATHAATHENANDPDLEGRSVEELEAEHDRAVQAMREHGSEAHDTALDSDDIREMQAASIVRERRTPGVSEMGPGPGPSITDGESAMGGESSGAINGRGGNPFLTEHRPPTRSRTGARGPSVGDATAFSMGENTSETVGMGGMGGGFESMTSGGDVRGSGLVGDAGNGPGFDPVSPDASGEPDWWDNPSNLDTPDEVRATIREGGENPMNVGTRAEATFGHSLVHGFADDPSLGGRTPAELEAEHDLTVQAMREHGVEGHDTPLDRDDIRGGSPAGGAGVEGMIGTPRGPASDRGGSEMGTAMRGGASMDAAGASMMGGGAMLSGGMVGGLVGGSVSGESVLGGGSGGGASMGEARSFIGMDGPSTRGPSMGSADSSGSFFGGGSGGSSRSGDSLTDIDSGGLI